MNAEPQTLRDAHKDLTRRRILDAAIAALASAPLEELTVARIARDAGVTERTVYRHFAARDDLISALWPRINDRAALGATFPQSVDEILKLPQAVFPAFDAEETLMRSIIFTRQGQALRLSVNDKRQEAYLKAMKAARPDLSPSERKRLAAAVQLLSTSFAWLSMKDYWGFDGEESGAVSAEAIDILLKHFGRDAESGARRKGRKP